MAGFASAASLVAGVRRPAMGRVRLTAWDESLGQLARAAPEDRKASAFRPFRAGYREFLS